MYFLLIIVFSIVAPVAEAQSGMLSSTTDTRNLPTLEAYDLSGKRIPTSDALIEGSPMLNTEFTKGTVRFRNDQQYKDVPINFSLLKNELYFKKDSTVLMFYNPVAEFATPVLSENPGKPLLFRSGYPVIGTNDEKTFYEVMADGAKVHLLKHRYTIVRDYYEYGGVIKKRFVSREDLYFYDVLNGQLREGGLNINSVKKALPGYSNTIDTLASKYKLKLKREEELIRLTELLNKEL